MMQKQVLITGVTGGIGSRIAERYAAIDGTQVIGIYRRDSGIDPGLARQGVVLIRADLHEQADISQALSRIECVSSGLDTVVIAHGDAPLIGPFDRLPWDQVRRLIETDLVGTMALIQGLIRLMAVPSHIVLISSIHGVSSYPYRVPYGVAKTGIAGFARALGVEMAIRGIRVNAICPGQVNGPRTDGVAADPSVIEKMRGRSPSRKLVDTQDIVETVLWLERTPAMNAQAVVLDHGVTASSYYDSF